jgi:hypothetical protein
MFSLCLAPAGEKLMYVPPIVSDQIQKLGIVKGEPFQVLKAEVPNGVGETVLDSLPDVGDLIVDVGDPLGGVRVVAVEEFKRRNKGAGA